MKQMISPSLFRLGLRFGFFAGILCASVSAQAQSSCRVVEVQFQPSPHLQIAVWIEDTNGTYVDTAYVTRTTGALGLGNRPGNALFKSAYRWPYGRRNMVLPVWAHERNHQYPYIIMGGAGGPDPDDDSVGYHEQFSSTEPFYCAPTSMPLDAVSCASQFNSSKGLFKPGSFSYYPPRADLTTFGTNDSADARTYASFNDIAAISSATPVGGALIDPDVRWAVPSTLPDGQYVVKVEVSLEGDFNASNHHPTIVDKSGTLTSYGVEELGQPSIVYAVPVTIDGTPETAITDGWLGYGDWDGSTGTLHPVDGTISDAPGTGAGRLAHITDADGTWRVKVFASGCQGCRPPAAPTAMVAKAADTSLSVDFAAPTSTDAFDKPRRYDIRYQPQTPLNDGNFANGVPADSPPPPGVAGTEQTATLTGLKAETVYFVGIRAVNACGGVGPAAFATATTQQQKFAVLHGCFIATAAYGSPMEPDVALLRRFRDGALLDNPLGKLMVATYYAMSPPLAHAIASDERLRQAARHALEPAVALARGWLLYKHPAR
jgi:hypothetical protein